MIQGKIDKGPRTPLAKLFLSLSQAVVVMCLDPSQEFDVRTAITGFPYSLVDVDGIALSSRRMEWIAQSRMAFDV